METGSTPSAPPRRGRGRPWFEPRRVLFEPGALEYPLGRALWERFSADDRVEVRLIGSHNRVTGIPGGTPQRYFAEAKRTLVVGVKRGLKEWEGCRPSAHYRYPLVTGCVGLLEPGWEDEYTALLDGIRERLDPLPPDLTFEVVTHRFTPKAKRTIVELFPKTPLDMREETRQFKWGQFGYGKYVYPADAMAEVREVMRRRVAGRFPRARLEYVV